MKAIAFISILIITFFLFTFFYRIEYGIMTDEEERERMNKVDIFGE